MRFYLFGPRFLGIRPGFSFQPSALRKLSSTPRLGSYIYVVNGDHGIKIGVTKNPDGRLAQLRTGSAAKIDYAYVAPASGDPYAIERAAHAMLERYRLNGEWFDVSPELAIAAVTGSAAKLGQSLTTRPDEAPAPKWPVVALFLGLWFAISAWVFWYMGPPPQY